MSKAILTTTTSGASSATYAQRPLTTIDYQQNPDGTAATFVSLAANQFTLTAGTYRIYATVKATGAAADNVAARIYNVTDASQVAEDAQQVAVASENVNLFLVGAFSITGSKVFELQGKGSAIAANGFGAAVGAFTVYYAVVEITKTA